jgi:hypothetical protein
LEKYRKYNTYVQSGIVNKADAYVVAINKSRLASRWAQAEADLPRFLKAIYPIGQLEFVIDIQEPRNAQMQNRSRFTIRKANNQEVPVQTFIDPGWSGLSGVICSDADAGCSYLPLGGDFEIAYNPLAQNEIPAGIIPACREWFSKLDGKWANSSPCRLHLLLKSRQTGQVTRLVSDIANALRHFGQSDAGSWMRFGPRRISGLSVATLRSPHEASCARGNRTTVRLIVCLSSVGAELISINVEPRLWVRL